MSVPLDSDPRTWFDPATTDENGVCDECRHVDYHSSNCDAIPETRP